MESNHALATLSALAHDMRLDVFRLLVRAGPEGMIAGQIAAALDIRANTLSNNLSILSGCGLIRAKREGRAIRYVADMEAMRMLLVYLIEDCCGGRPDICRPALDQLCVTPLPQPDPRPA